MSYWTRIQSDPPAWTLAPDGYAQGAVWWLIVVWVGVVAGAIGVLAGWV